jgi:hypothetical protein
MKKQEIISIGVTVNFTQSEFKKIYEKAKEKNISESDLIAIIVKKTL